MGNGYRIGFIAFDIDGTLYSTEEILLDAYKVAINKINNKYNTNFLLPKKEQIFQLVGYPYKFIYKTLFPEMNDEMIEEFGTILRENLANLVNTSNKGFLGDVKYICKTLNEMNIGLVAASNGNKTYVESVLKKGEILQYFEPLITVDYVKYFNKTDILKEYISSLEPDKNKWLMVGDRYSDYEAAKNCGIKFVAVNFGHGDLSEFPEYDYILNKLEDIIEVAKKHFKII